LAITTAGLSEIEGFSAGWTGAGGAAGFCEGAAGAVCAVSKETEKQSKAIEREMRAGEGACGPQVLKPSDALLSACDIKLRHNLICKNLIRNNLENNGIV
jgi:hypothetical protein